jgi:hypothetical protein
MPNWVHHNLTITGPEIEQERFLAECFTQDGRRMEFDFDKLIPQPDEIRRSVEASRAFMDAVLLSGKTSWTGPHPADDDESWYDWRCDNWGTKWNADDTKIVRKGDAIKLSFETAWAAPIPIFKAVAARFPKLTITGSIIEEYHHFGWDVLFQNGSLDFLDRSEELRRAYDDRMRQSALAAKQQPDDTKTKDDELPF